MKIWGIFEFLALFKITFSLFCVIKCLVSGVDPAFYLEIEKWLSWKFVRLYNFKGLVNFT